MRAPLPVLAGLLGAFAMAPTQAGTPSCGSAARYTGAFIYSHSSHSVFKLGGNQTWARGIGAAGLVVAEWVPEGKTATDAVYWNNTVPHSIGLCCSGTLKGANARGDMAGDVYDEQGHYSSPWIRNGIRRQR